ncbi:MAG: zinc-ribbon and DUF3426 domain-containing protein [Pseudomonadota bacterium]
MIVECPHCGSHLRTDSRALKGATTVRCGACLGEFDALEHIKLDSAVGMDPAGDPRVRKHSLEREDVEGGSASTPAVQQRRSVLSNPAPPTPRPRWAPLGGVLALAAVGIGGLHLARDQLASHPTGHALVSRWCAWVGCDVTPQQDYSAIRLLRRQIYAHPSRVDALVISLAMVNDAHFAQDFPVLRVRMTDQAGDVVARGEFAPAEYLDTFDTSVLMQPGRAVDVQLEVADPGDDAVSFDLEFH